MTGPGAGRGADQRLVEKAAEALVEILPKSVRQNPKGIGWLHEPAWDDARLLAHAALAAVWDEIHERGVEEGLDNTWKLKEHVAEVRAAARREVAEEIAAAIEAERVGNAPADYVAGLNDGAYIAREAASSEEASDDG